MFSKKHYEQIASNISDAYAKANPAGQIAVEVVDELVWRLSELFAADNPNFNAVRFRAACERGRKS